MEVQHFVIAVLLIFTAYCAVKLMVISVEFFLEKWMNHIESNEYTGLNSDYKKFTEEIRKARKVIRGLEG